MSDEQPQPPATDDDEAWRAYWAAQGMPWRTEPEIDKGRQRFLAERRAVKPNIERGIYPFRDENGSIKLTRADVEWLLATHESGGVMGPVDYSDAKQAERKGLDLRGADLRNEFLTELPLSSMRGGIGQADDFGDWFAATPEQFELAAVHLEGAVMEDVHLEEANMHSAHLEGAMLEGVYLESVDLEDAYLEGADLLAGRMRKARLRGAHLEGALLYGADLEEAELCSHPFEDEASGWAELHLPQSGTFAGSQEGTAVDQHAAHLEGANLRRADLRGATINWVHLAGVDLQSARLERASLEGVYLGGKQMGAEDLERIRRWQQFPDLLPPADMRHAFLDEETKLDGIRAGNNRVGARLADVRWGGADLTTFDWEAVRFLSDEEEARRPKTRGGKDKDAATRRSEFGAAVRAYRQLSTALRGQGLNEPADRFAYRAQLLQRVLLRRQRKWGRWLGTGLLDVISGYGYKPMRSVVTYVLVIVAFAALYFVLGGAHGQALSWNEALVVSLTAFHGRGFFATAFQPGDPQAAVAALEAVIGLLIEITFIATFTNRFFAR